MIWGKRFQTEITSEISKGPKGDVHVIHLGFFLAVCILGRRVQIIIIIQLTGIHRYGGTDPKVIQGESVLSCRGSHMMCRPRYNMQIVVFS